MLNSKDYGVPQSRERIYIIGMLGSNPFQFPTSLKLNVSVSAIMEPIVDEKYFLKKKYVRFFLNYCKKQKCKNKDLRKSGIKKLGQIIAENSQGYRVYDPEGVGCTLSALGGGLGAKTGLWLVGKVANYQQGIGVYSPAGASPTLMAKGGGIGDRGGLFVLSDEGSLRIRRLTPRECARLQGFPDSFIIPVSDSQAYKQFGNSVSVPVIEALANQLIKALNE